MAELAKRISDAPAFQHFITLVIVLAGVVVGVETDPDSVAAWGPLLVGLDRAILGIFALEIGIKLLAHGRRPWRYLRDPWNVFDFTIVLASLLMAGTAYVTVLRLLRLLRVVRLVHAVPRLQILVSALLRSLPSMGYVAAFLALLFYVYGVAGVFLFGKNDPVHFGNLGSAMLSLFTVVTLEGWADLMYTQLYGCARFGYEESAHLCTQPLASPVGAPAYFVSFILFGTMIVLNLFIGVIMNSMQEAAFESQQAIEKKRLASQPGATVSLQHEVAELIRRHRELLEHLARLEKRTAQEHEG